ncbi:MAG: BatA domain-containing protein [Bacteroidales bacterium]|nr:BatA domain-containing protein [Bacteroidales bacterium]
MSFLNPSFLWAMFAVSIPIIIHLINFRRHKTLYFSNTSFLQDLKKETKTRTKLKQILILIARILTIAMLVIAFAGPFIRSNAGNNQQKSEVNIIYIDNSFSMEAEGKKGVVFEQARQIAKQIIFNSDANKEYILITNDMLPQHQFVLGRDKLLQEIDEISIGSSPASLNDVILKANTLLPQDKTASLYIISDMQKSFIPESKIVPNKNINTVFIPLETTVINNMFIDTCWFASPVHRIGQDEELIVKIVNHSDEDFADIPVQLFINDSLKALSSLNIEANQTEELSIKYVNTASGFFNARLEISDYPVTYDNVLYFNYRADKQTNVLILNSENTDNNYRYLRSVYQSDPANFVLHEIKLGNQQASQFGNYDIILLNNIAEISSGLAADLQSFVSGGGSVVLIPRVEIKHHSLNNFLALFNAGKFENLKINSKTIKNIDYENVIFKDVFVDNSSNTDFPVLGLVHKYVMFNSSPFASLISLENNTPLLVSGNYNKGNLYVFTAPVSEINAEMLKSPVFAPVFFNLAVNSQISSSLYAIIGQGASVDISYPYEIAASDVFSISDNKNMDAIVQYNAVGKNLRVFMPQEIKIAGNYKLFRADNYISPISVNYNRLESILDYYDKTSLNKIIKEKIGDNAKIIDATSDDIAVELKKVADGDPLWQWFLIFALVFIICEIMLARLFK